MHLSNCLYVYFVLVLKYKFTVMIQKHHFQETMNHVSMLKLILTVLRGGHDTVSREL